MTKRNDNDLVIGGFLPVTTVDFPDRLASVVFCQGCMWRCSYCHNVDLQSLSSEKTILWREVFAKIQARKRLIEAVVFSGGEPLMQPAVEEAIEQVKSLGLKVGLHTNGVQFETFKTVLPMLDWIGIDIKTRFSDYQKITCRFGSGETVKKSLSLLIASGIAYETRTTISPEVHTVNDILSMAEEIAEMGVKTFALQAYRAVCDKQRQLEFKNIPFFLREVTEKLDSLFEHFISRHL
ncbi:MAG: anaerobic ribonucleoside-triphosphate reductase activating protein [Holosporales bacterium]|jgi:anaerobic ribonucleoside-triphosphate reductase activating protein|nr:anaerobic ribonucleoside-triphosphate reductase activating protein [Holosporales bacterium]